MFEQHATHSIDAEEAYRSFGRVGLEYGPTHRTLAAVCSTEQGALHIRNFWLEQDYRLLVYVSTASLRAPTTHQHHTGVVTTRARTR